MSDGPELLNRFLDSRSNADFEALVEAHAGLVMGTAMRSTRDRGLAEEVMQDVFVLLAKKAGEIREPHKLAAWLHRTTVLTAANVVRREARRRLKMKSYEQQRDREWANEVNRSTWEEVLPQLDQALNRLSSEDRDLVLLRFYEGQSYPSIATMLQRSEDACRMRLARALKRLSRSLRHAGVTVPAAVLGAGLSGRIAEGVSIEMVHHVSQTALQTSLVSQTNSIFTLNLTAMSSIKTTAMIGFVAFLAPIGIQLAGHDLMKRTVVDRQPAGDFNGASSVLELDRKRPVPADRGDGMSRRELAATLKRLAADANPERAQAAICQFLLQLSHEELPRVLPVLPDLPGFNMRYEMIQALFTRWASFDPREALEVAETLTDLSHRIGARGGAFRAWSIEDPAAAKAYFLSLEPGERREDYKEHYWAARRDQDPQATANEALELQNESDRDAVLDHVVRHWKKSNPHEAIAWLREFPDGARRDRWLEDTVVECSYNDPEGAVAYAGEFFEGFHEQKILGRVMGNWAFADPGAALENLLDLPEEQRTADMMQRLSGELRDIDTAKQLLTQVPEGERPDFIIGLSRAVLQRRFFRDQVEIGELTKTIPDEKARRYAVKLLAQGWLVHDKRAALDWVRNSDAVTPRAREEILTWAEAR